MKFGSFGGSGGPVMKDGPEMVVFVCVCSIVSVYGPEKGEFICVFILSNVQKDEKGSEEKAGPLSE